MEQAALAAIVAIGFLIVAGPISDNSMLVHLATGVQVWSDGIPRRDPYSFTAFGEPWIVQSWLAEWTYGALLELAGLKAVIVEHMLIATAVAFLMTRMLRTGSMVRTVIAAVCVFCLSLPFWTHRPFMFGLLWFTVLVYVVVSKRSAWWLVPVGWLWVNTHGSFPLGLAWLVAYLVGSRIDRGVIDRRVAKAAGTFVLGLCLGAINPLGPRLLLFPFLIFGDRRDIFPAIQEWKSPSFQSGVELVLLAALTIAFVVLARSRVSWRNLLPAALFLAAALHSVRNMPSLAVVLCPALAEALRVRVPEEGGERESNLVPLAVVCLLPVLAAGGLVRVLSSPAIDTSTYPVAALEWLDTRSDRASLRLAAPEFVGCYLIYERGRAANVFFDDRFDLYPASVSTDYLALRTGKGEPGPILDRYQIDAVLWEKDHPLANYLSGRPGWATSWSDDEWVVVSRSP